VRSRFNRRGIAGGIFRSRLGVEHLDMRKDKAEAAAGQRLDIARTFRLIVQRLPQLFDGGADAMFKLNDCAAWPKAFADLVSRDEFSGMLEQHQE
jgi:hypothetical protein